MTPPRAEPSRRTSAVVLAAGLGTRMHSRTPKILHPLCGRPMLAYVLDAWDEAATELGDGSAAKPVVVYSPATEAVRDVVDGRGTLALQDVPRGTGDAVRAALDALPEDVEDLFVLS
ncbi:MAG: bifunctional UDP-N-acetylglucosamine pyrophosphorylase / glucosamine-phosphate N-acetyltransferase, partial [Chloroflexota bacterium]|nr:bifunctional UDP-N-acetylglucosamine pyrophosphorylase / glucosamine-phosphate N-acetyltransferase [Chloroflexota bacterium]